MGTISPSFWRPLSRVSSKACTIILILWGETTCIHQTSK
jgi:hypothetical protein